MCLEVTGEATVLKRWPFSHTFKIGGLCPSKEEALISLAWSLYAFCTTSSNDVSCISPEYHMKGKQKESVMCGLDLQNEIYYHRFTVSTPTNFDRFIFALRNRSMVTFWCSYLLLTLDLGVILTSFKAYFGN